MAIKLREWSMYLLKNWFSKCYFLPLSSSSAVIGGVHSICKRGLAKDVYIGFFVVKNNALCWKFV